MTRAEKLAFIAAVVPAAQASQKKYGVPASITIAQAMIESADADGNWGNGILAREDNNYFGIKARAGEEYCEHPAHEFINGVSTAVRAKFRKFKTIQDCFDRHGELLSGADRYQPAMSVADDPLAFALKLGPKQAGGCGYSTNPGYAKLLTDKIRQWNLSEYDAPTAQGVKA